MGERVHRHRGAELLELERERRVHGLDAVDHDRQPGLRRGRVHGVVALVAVQRLQAAPRQVHAGELAAARVGEDVASAGLRVLRRHHQRTLQGSLLGQPPLVQPAVVGAGEGGRERGIADDRQRQQVVGKQHRLVDVQLVEALAHLPGGGHDLAPVGAARERDPVLGARRHPWQVQVTLLDGRDLAQAHVPRRLCVFGQLRRILVDVHVGVDHERVGQCLALPGGAFSGGDLGGHRGLVSQFMNRDSERTGAGGVAPFHVHPGHLFEGFELVEPEGEPPMLLARCSCGEVLDTAQARFTRAPGAAAPTASGALRGHRAGGRSRGAGVARAGRRRARARVAIRSSVTFARRRRSIG